MWAVAVVVASVVAVVVARVRAEALAVVVHYIIIPVKIILIYRNFSYMKFT